MFKYTKKLEELLANKTRELESYISKMESACAQIREDNSSTIVSIRNDFNARMLDKDSVIEDLRLRLSVSEAECERMRMIMLPLSSAPGAAYARSKYAQPTRESSTKLSNERIPSTSWPDLLKETVAKMDKEAEQEDKSKPAPKE